MKKIFALLALATLAVTPAIASAQDGPAAVTTGKMLYAADGKRIAAVYRVSADGSPQVIFQGKLVTVPASTVTVDGDKVTTTMTKAAIATSR